MADPTTLPDDADYLSLFSGDQGVAQSQAAALANAIRQRRAAGTLGLITGDPAMSAVGKEMTGDADQMERTLIGAAQHRASMDIQRQHLAAQLAQIQAMNDYRNSMLGLRGQGLDIQQQRVNQPHYAIDPNTGARYNTKGGVGGQIIPGATAAAGGSAGSSATPTVSGPAPASSGGSRAPQPFSGKMLDKMLNSLGQDFDPTSSRAGEFGRNYARANAANRILALAQKPDGTPADLTPQQMTEVASSLGTLISAGGQPSERITHEMTPYTAGRTWAEFMQKITNDPHGTNQQGFVQQAIDTAKREQGVAQQAIEQSRQQRAMKHQVVLRSNPEESRNVLKPFGWDLDPNGKVVMQGQVPTAKAALSPQDAQAKAWAEANPTDPRAAKILSGLKAGGP